MQGEHISDLMRRETCLRNDGCTWQIMGISPRVQVMLVQKMVSRQPISSEYSPGELSITPGPRGRALVAGSTGPFSRACRLLGVLHFEVS